jgi:radical SAM protein with 4Fe4S-binding SPASM domain
VLDVGYANAESRYLLARTLLTIPCLVGLDMAAAPQPGIAGVAGDALAAPFLPDTFDLIFAISVIEHIGRDNSIYFDRNQPAQEFGDLAAASNLASLVRPAGRLLVTVPFGRLEDHGWFVQYDLRRVEALLEATGCELTLAEYYRYGYQGWPEGWYGPVDPFTLSDIAYRTGLGAGAVACLEFTRRNGPIHKTSAPDYATLMQSSAASSLSSALSPQTARILKLSGAWSKMRGEAGPMRPVMLFCETVNICNADCVFCPYSAQTRPRGFMQPELFSRVLDQYCQIGGGHLTLTPMVGDALLDRLWMQRIRLLAETCDQITASVTSNLYALDKYSDDEVLEMLKVLRRIHISCYGITAGECEALTRRRVFDRFLSQTRRLLSLRQASRVDCDVRVGFRLAQPRSTEELEAFLRTNLGHILPFGATSTYANWGNSMQGALPLEANWIPPRTNESACVMLPLAVQIYWDGRVSACSCCDYDSGDQLYLGDVTRQSLRDIFNGPESQAVWRAHETGKLQPICRHCTFHVPLTTLTSNHPIVQNPLDFIGG